MVYKILGLWRNDPEDIQYINASPRLFFVANDKKREQLLVYCYREEADDKQTHLFDISTKDDTIVINSIYHIGEEKGLIKSEHLYSFFLFESKRKGNGWNERGQNGCRCS